ncbi:MAG: sodium:proline symporter, partial [Firmicutes bacterium]|nr:sodium:proline symporter [Bacillota bacterium]
LSLFWRRFTYKGAVAGVISGSLTDVLWYMFLSESTGIYELFPGFIAGLLFSVVVTLLDRQPEEAVLTLFDKATDSTCDE